MTGERFPLMSILQQFKPSTTSTGVIGNGSSFSSKSAIEQQQNQAMMRFPLLGTDVSLESAQHLAHRLDELGGN